MNNIYNLQNSDDPIYYRIMQSLVDDLNDCIRIIFCIPYVNIGNEKFYFKIDYLFDILYTLMDDPNSYNALMLTFLTERMIYNEKYLLFVIEYYSFVKSLTIETVGR